MGNDNKTQTKKDNSITQRLPTHSNVASAISATLIPIALGLGVMVGGCQVHRNQINHPIQSHHVVESKTDLEMLTDAIVQIEVDSHYKLKGACTGEETIMRTTYCDALAINHTKDTGTMFVTSKNCVMLPETAQFGNMVVGETKTPDHEAPVYKLSKRRLKIIQELGVPTDYPIIDVIYTNPNSDIARLHADGIFKLAKNYFVNLSKPSVGEIVYIAGHSRIGELAVTKAKVADTNRMSKSLLSLLRPYGRYEGEHDFLKITGERLFGFHGGAYFVMGENGVLGLSGFVESYAQDPEGEKLFVTGTRKGLEHLKTY